MSDERSLGHFDPHKMVQQGVQLFLQQARAILADEKNELSSQIRRELELATGRLTDFVNEKTLRLEIEQREQRRQLDQLQHIVGEMDTTLITLADQMREQGETDYRQMMQVLESLENLKQNIETMNENIQRYGNGDD